MKKKINNYRSQIAAIFQLPSYLLWVAMLMIVMAILSFEFIYSAVTVWSDSETFNHCFTVYPIALYLVWQKKKELSYIQPSFSPSLFLLLFMCMPLWMLAYAGNIDVLGHLVSCLMISMVAISALGWRIAFILVFPFFFAFFAVPIGEELIPLFQRITADFAVKLLLLSDVPVFFEGLFIQIPEGKFLVAEACSGIRFFVSTVMLGVLSAYLLFNSWQKRFVFIIFSIFLPIVANIIRVYSTIMVGHLIGMEYAASADHLVYGWYFFAIVTILLISTAIYFREDKKILIIDTNIPVETNNAWASTPGIKIILIYVSFFSVFIGWKHLIDNSNVNSKIINTDILSSNYSAAAIKRSWQPSFKGYSQAVSLADINPQRVINLDLFYYDGSSSDAELVSWYNRLYDPNKWTLVSSQKEKLSIKGVSLNYAIINLISNRGESRSVLYWYQLGKFNSPNTIWVKLRRAFNVMVGENGSGAFISISLEGGDVLQRKNFMHDWLKKNYSEVYSIF